MKNLLSIILLAASLSASAQDNKVNQYDIFGIKYKMTANADLTCDFYRGFLTTGITAVVVNKFTDRPILAAVIASGVGFAQSFLDRGKEGRTLSIIGTGAAISFAYPIYLDYQRKKQQKLDRIMDAYQNDNYEFQNYNLQPISEIKMSADTLASSSLLSPSSFGIYIDLTGSDTTLTSACKFKSEYQFDKLVKKLKKDNTAYKNEVGIRYKNGLEIETYEGLKNRLY